MIGKYVQRVLRCGSRWRPRKGPTRERGPGERVGVRRDRGRHRGDPRRAHPRRGRRRGPRERGRPAHGRRQGDPRGRQLHGQVRARADLHAHARRAPRRAADLHDGLRQHRAARHRLHGQRGRPPRRDHRAPPPTTARSPSARWSIRRRGRRTSRARATSSRCGPCRAACSAAPATPRPRSTWPGWPAARRPGSSARCSTTTAGWRALPELMALAPAHGLKVITIKDLIEYRIHKEKLVRRAATTRMPTEYGEFTGHRLRDHGGRAACRWPWCWATWQDGRRRCWCACTPSA